MNFRQATSADINAMMKIRNLVSENKLSDPTKVTTQMYLDYLDKLGRGWVCEDDNKVVGFCYADKVNQSIWALFLDPGYEGMGIGKQLLQLAVDYLFSLGAERISLFTEANTHADRFYQAMGWQRGDVNDNGEVEFSLTAIE